jgi:hypothetical protein
MLNAFNDYVISEIHALFVGYGRVKDWSESKT